MEKILCKILFFVISGAQGDSFYAYAPYNPELALKVCHFAQEIVVKCLIYTSRKIQSIVKNHITPGFNVERPVIGLL